MKRYMTFRGSYYYPLPCMQDFVGDFDTLEEAVRVALSGKQPYRSRTIPDDIPDDVLFKLGTSIWACVWDCEEHKNAWSTDLNFTDVPDEDRNS